MRPACRLCCINAFGCVGVPPGVDTLCQNAKGLLGPGVSVALDGGFGLGFVRETDIDECRGGGGGGRSWVRLFRGGRGGITGCVSVCEVNARFGAGEMSWVDRDRFRNGFVLVGVVGSTGRVGGFGGTAGAGSFDDDADATGGFELRVSRDGFRE